MPRSNSKLLESYRFAKEAKQKAAKQYSDETRLSGIKSIDSRVRKVNLLTAQFNYLELRWKRLYNIRESAIKLGKKKLQKKVEIEIAETQKKMDTLSTDLDIQKAEIKRGTKS